MQQHYKDLFPAKSPLTHEMLAQAGLGLLLLERQEQEKRAVTSSGEKSVHVKLFVFRACTEQSKVKEDPKM